MNELKDNGIRTSTAPSFEAEFALRYPNSAYLLRDMRTAFGVEAVSWGDLTRPNLVKFADRIKESHSPNGARTLLAVVKAFLNIYAEEGLIPCRDFAKVLKSRRAPSQHVALTPGEIARIEAYEPQSVRESDIKVLAMRELLTGARGCDCTSLSNDNVNGGVISYVSRKTRRESVLPAHAMLGKYLTAQVSRDDYSRATKNRVLQRICRKCGIDSECKVYVGGKDVTAPKYKLVGFHTLRRSFATNLVAKGVPIPVVQQWMGHSSAAVTQRYICMDMSDANRQYAALFR